MEKIRDYIFIYEGQKVKVLLTDNSEIQDNLESYNEAGITLLKSKRTLSFDEIKDLFYVGKVTGYDTNTGTGMIDNTYSFEKFDFIYSTEQDYSACCHLEIREADKLIEDVNAAVLEIAATDVNINKLENNLLDAEFLKNRLCLYAFKNGKKVVGAPSKEKEGYKLVFKENAVVEAEAEDICEIQRAPKKNDYINVITKKGDFTGLVLKEDAEYCILLTDNRTQIKIAYDDIKEIGYYGEIRIIRSNGRESRKCIAKLYGNEEFFTISAECDEDSYKNGTMVTFAAKVDDINQPRDFEGIIKSTLLVADVEKPVEKRVPVVVRRYEEREVEGDRFYVILKSDYDDNIVTGSVEKIVYADENNAQSQWLKKKFMSEESELYDYAAEIDIYENDRCVFCAENKIAGSKIYDKKFLANYFKYNREQGWGFASYKNAGHYFNIRNLAKKNAVKWNGGFKNFAQYIGSLKYEKKDKADIYRYHVVYTLKKVEGNGKQNFKYEVKTIHFVGVEGVNNAYDDVKTIVPFETLRRKLADKYGEISKERAKDYKFGFLNVWPTDKDSVKLLSGYRPNYEKNSDDELAEIEVEIQKENFVLEEELDIDYVKYLMAYLEEDKKSENSADNRCYMVEKYAFGYSEVANSAVIAVRLIENGIEITTRKKCIVDMDKRMWDFRETMKPFRDKITDKAPELMTYENVLVKTEKGYELKEGKDMEGIWKDVYRFGILTAIDPKQEYGYIDNRLQFAFEKLRVPAFNNYTRCNRRNVVICYCCDEDGSVSKVLFPTKEMISALKWDTRNSMVYSVENIDAKGIKEYVAKVELWQGEHLNRSYANYYFSGDDDAVVKRAAESGELKGKYVFVKTVCGHAWVEEESLRSQKTLLPCYVVAINMQVEELSIVEEKGHYVARRNHNTLFPINGLVNEIISGLEKRELQLKIDESGYGLEVNKNTEESSEEFLKKNPYEKAAQGESLDKDSKVYFKREEENTVWKVISDENRKIEKAGNAVIVYGQKRCGKTSLIKKIKNEIEAANENVEKQKKTIIIEYNNVKPILDISKQSDIKDSAEKLYREILRNLMNREDAVININEEHRKTLELSMKSELEKYDWTSIFKTAMETLKNPIIVIMDEFTDVCESVLAKYEGNWKELELAKKEFDFIGTLKECNVIPIIIGHENMHSVLNELRLTNAISAKSEPIELNCFSDPSADGLIRIPIREVIGYYDPYGDSKGESEKDMAGRAAVSYMMELTGKNPSVLMKLCDLMYKHYGDNKNYIDYSMEKKILEKENVKIVIDEWIERLTADKADTLFDMILREPADDWFFYDNEIYRFVFAGCKATESLAYVYLECAAKNILKYGECACDNLYKDVFSSIQKKLEDRYNYAAKNARRDKNALKNAAVCRELSEEDKTEFITDMCKIMEDKLAKRRIICITNGKVDIEMKLFVEYVKKHKL